MFKKILIPLDGSPLAEYALVQAFRLGEPAGAALTLLRVPVLKTMLAPEPAGYGWLLPEQSLAQSHDEAVAYLESCSEGWATRRCPVATMVVDGDEASAIVDTAAELDVDLIAMSTHGWSGLRRWLLGSVTERVLHQAPCPVLVTRNKEPIKHIMIALDGSPIAEQALTPALALAQTLRARLTLAHVAVQPGFDLALQPTGSELEQGHRPATLAQLRARGQAYLQDLYDGYWWDGLQVDTVVLDGPVAEALLAQAAAQAIDCIVMATHGRTGLGRWLYGSITEKVLRHYDKNMLIVRPPRRLLR